GGGTRSGDREVDLGEDLGDLLQVGGDVHLGRGGVVEGGQPRLDGVQLGELIPGGSVRQPVAEHPVDLAVGVLPAAPQGDGLGAVVHQRAGDALGDRLGGLVGGEGGAAHTGQRGVLGGDVRVGVPGAGAHL